MRTNIYVDIIGILIWKLLQFESPCSPDNVIIVNWWQLLIRSFSLAVFQNDRCEIRLKIMIWNFAVWLPFSLYNVPVLSNYRAFFSLVILFLISIIITGDLCCLLFYVKLIFTNTSSVHSYVLNEFILFLIRSDRTFSKTERLPCTGIQFLWFIPYFSLSSYQRTFWRIHFILGCVTAFELKHRNLFSAYTRHQNSKVKNLIKSGKGASEIFQKLLGFPPAFTIVAHRMPTVYFGFFFS